MSFILHPHNSPGARLRKLLLREIDQAVAAIPGVDVDEAIHFIRRCGKRSLAALRLLRAVLPAAALARVRKGWRDVMRALAPGRDAAALAAAVKRLSALYPRRSRSTTFKQYRSELDDAASTALDKTRSRLPAITAMLLRIRHRVAAWEPHSSWRRVWRGFAHSYRRAHRAYRAAGSHSSRARRHRWRKRAKDMLHQIHLLRAVWPPLMQVQEERWNRLGDLLGEERDLRLLGDHLRAEYADSAPILELIERRAANLVRRAKASGATLHRQSTSAHLAMLRRHADAAGFG